MVGVESTNESKADFRKETKSQNNPSTTIMKVVGKTTTMNHRNSLQQRERTKFLGACLFGSFLTILFQRLLPLFSSRSCQISLGTYQGPEKDPPTHRRTCLFESKYLKLQQHEVEIADSDAPIIPDWLWIDYHFRINVLVQLAADGNTTVTQQRFLVFHQTKYGLEGQYSLAVVGGIVEPGEDPVAAAPREVQEETGMTCTRFVPLGEYRTDVNRGLGWSQLFLAQGCRANAGDGEIIQSSTTSSRQTEDEVGGADMERQDVKIMKLNELRQAVEEGKFMEIWWTATVALAIQYIESNQAST